MLSLSSEHRSQSGQESRGGGGGLRWHLCHRPAAAPNSKVKVSSRAMHSVRHSDHGSVTINSLLFETPSFMGFPTSMSPSIFEHSIIVTTVQEREETCNFKC